MITERSVAARGVSQGVILAILHQEHSTCGRVGHILRQQGFTIEIRRPSLGCALPSSLEGYSGVMVFGGPMSANDEHEWLRREIPAARSLPLLRLLAAGRPGRAVIEYLDVSRAAVQVEPCS